MAFDTFKTWMAAKFGEASGLNIYGSEANVTLPNATDVNLPVDLLQNRLIPWMKDKTLDTVIRAPGKHFACTYRYRASPSIVGMMLLTKALYIIKYSPNAIVVPVLVTQIFNQELFELSKAQGWIYFCTGDTSEEMNMTQSYDEIVRNAKIHLAELLINLKHRNLTDAEINELDELKADGQIMSFLVDKYPAEYS